MQGLNLEYMWDLVPILLGYVPLTLFMAVVGMACALVLASILAVERVFQIPVHQLLSRHTAAGSAVLVLLWLATGAIIPWHHQRRNRNDHGADAAFLGLYGREHSRSHPRG